MCCNFVDRHSTNSTGHPSCLVADTYCDPGRIGGWVCISVYVFLDEARQLVDVVQSKIMSPSQVTLMPFVPLKRRLLQRHLTSPSNLQLVCFFLRFTYLLSFVDQSLSICSFTHERFGCRLKSSLELEDYWRSQA